MKVLPMYPRVLFVSAGSARKSSFVARLAWLDRHPVAGFSVAGVCGWPYDSTKERLEAFARIQAARKDADIVVLHRVLFERRLREAFFSINQPVIYDFDDAIYAVPSVSYRRELRTVRGWLTRGFRLAIRFRADYSGRFRPLVGMLRRVDAVAAGNPHLARFASGYCPRIAVVPTVVDADSFPVKTHSDNGVATIGWYGAPENHWYLSGLGSVFQGLQGEFGARVRFAIISSEPCQIKSVKTIWIPWQPSRELQDLLSFDVGVMPLTDDEWGRGKCANKAIYYMAAGLPPVVSPVGVNAELVEHGISGFLARNAEEWTDILSRLICSSGLRRELGGNARKRALERYSRSVAASKMSALITMCLGSARQTV